MISDKMSRVLEDARFSGGPFYSRLRLRREAERLEGTRREENDYGKPVPLPNAAWEAYTCPSCLTVRPFRNRRQIRIPSGASQIICIQCYNLGPVRVGENLRKSGVIAI